MGITGYINYSDKEELKTKQKILNENGIKKEEIIKEKIQLDKSKKVVLNKTINKLNQNDILIVNDLTQIALSIKELLKISKMLNERGIFLKSIKEGLDTTTKEGKEMFKMLLLLNQFQNDIISLKTKSGIIKSKEHGKIGGRPKTSQEKIDMAIMLYDMGTLNYEEVCLMSGVKKSTLYNYLNKRKKELNQSESI